MLCVVRGVEEVGRRGEFGETKTTRKQDPRQTIAQQRIQHAITHLPIRNMASREEDQGRTVANQSRKRDKSQRSIWTACSWTPRRKNKTWAFLSGKENERQELCSAPWARGKRGEKGYAEG